MDTRIIIGAAGVVVGAAVSAFVTWRLLKAHYEEITQEEIDSVKSHYAKLFKVGEHADLSNIVAKYKGQVTDLGYSSVSEDDGDAAEDNSENDEVVPDETDEGEDEPVRDDRPEPQRQVQNVWKYAKDHPHPEDEAYVITFDQFNDEHDDYDKGDLTYYEGDDTLVDSQESPIDDVEGLIGPDALDRFGDGSNSRDIVYVRNDRVSMDFEISRDDRSYTEHVLGIQEPKKRKVHKMRDEE